MDEIKIENTYTGKEAADRIGCPLKGLPRYIRDGRLTPYIVDKATGKLVPGGGIGKRQYYPKHQVDHFERRQPGRPRHHDPSDPQYTYNHEYYLKRKEEKQRSRHATAQTKPTIGGE